MAIVKTTKREEIERESGSIYGHWSCKLGRLELQLICAPILNHMLIACAYIIQIFIKYRIVGTLQMLGYQVGQVELAQPNMSLGWVGPCIIHKLNPKYSIS